MGNKQLPTELQFENVTYAREEQSGVIRLGTGTIKAWKVVASATLRGLGALGGVGQCHAIMFPGHISISTCPKMLQLLVGGSYDRVGQLCTPQHPPPG